METLFLYLASSFLGMGAVTLTALSLERTRGFPHALARDAFQLPFLLLCLPWSIVFALGFLIFA